MANLITRARAIKNLDDRATTADEDDTLDNLIAAVSAAVERFCRREFHEQAFDEVHNGRGGDELLLRHFPIVSVARVACQPTTVLTVSNTSAANQRATVRVTDTGLTLTRVASGVSSSDTSVTWAANVTLSAVKDAVNALGNGWSAAIADASHNDRASADLRALQGAFPAKDVHAELQLHTEEVGDFAIDAERGALKRSSWHGGRDYWRVLYTAGFDPVPEDVQEACAIWTATLFWQTKRDPGLTQEAITGAVSRSPTNDMPGQVRELLVPYRTF